MRRLRYLLTAVRIIFYIGIFFHLLPCWAQINTESRFSRDSLYQHISCEKRAEFSCRFTYAQDNAFISASLGCNAVELDKLDCFLRQALAYPHLSVRRIRLIGYSSIEGDYAHNEALARDRVEEFFVYLSRVYPELNCFPYHLSWVGEDWDGLAGLVCSSDINECEEILEIIRKVRVHDDREALLMKLNGGKAYRIMEQTLFPRLRKVELQIEYNIVERDDEHLHVTPDFRANRSLALANAHRQGASSSLPFDGQQSSDWQHTGVMYKEPYSNARFALKTNALLWIGIQSNLKHTTPVANVALEYYISDHWSVELGAKYSYWRYNSNQEFQGISGYHLEPRYRFALPPMRKRMEMFLGLYGRVGDYDLRTDNHTRNYTEDYWDVGLSGGVTIKLIGPLALELGIRGGYMRTKPIKYKIDNLNNWFDTQYKYNQYKVTDLNVGLIYKFR